jgi:opacity protein-like surface antigen
MLGQLLLLGLLVRGAQAAEPAVATGFYLGAGGGAAKHDVSNGGALGQIIVAFSGFGGVEAVQAVPRASLETDSDSTGWRGLAGYRFNRYLAAELEYLDFGSAEIHETYNIVFGFGPVPTVIAIEQDFTTDVSGPAVSALGKLPVGERFELFLRGGVLFVDSKVRLAQRFQPSSNTYSDRVLLGGIGVDWNFAGRWSARLEYQRSQDIERNAEIGESHVELLSLGVLFKL